MVDVLWQSAYYKVPLHRQEFGSELIPVHLDRPQSQDRVRPEGEQLPLVSLPSIHPAELMFSMLNDKRGPIGKALQGIRPEHRELWFIFGQLSESSISRMTWS